QQLRSQKELTVLRHAQRITKIAESAHIHVGRRVAVQYSHRLHPIYPVHTSDQSERTYIIALSQRSDILDFVGVRSIETAVVDGFDYVVLPDIQITNEIGSLTLRDVENAPVAWKLDRAHIAQV